MPQHRNGRAAAEHGGAAPENGGAASARSPVGAVPGPDPTAWVERAHRALRGRGHRVGPARERVILAIAEGGRTTAKTLAEQLSAGPERIAISSVYRSLAALVDAGTLRTIELAGAVHYEPAGLTEGGGRYLVCRLCGRAASYASPVADAAIASAAAAVGFEVRDDDVVAYGRCPSCVDGRASSRNAGASPGDDGAMT